MTQQQVVNALLQAGGDVSVAAVLLSTTQDDLKLRLAEDPSLLQMYNNITKLDLATALYRLLQLSYIEISQRLNEIPPQDLIKSHSVLLERFLDLTEGRFKTQISTTTNFIKAETILKELPAEIRDNVIELIQHDADADADIS